jgi:response regulator RpfG family c-di-GMP phosphodiesterase
LDLRNTLLVRKESNRGTILLFDDTPQMRTARAEHLVGRSFRVQLASTAEQAEKLWQPNRYVLVLLAVRNNLGRAVQLCERIKREDRRQMVGMLVPPTTELPPTHCPDLLWPEEGLEYFLARVETLADFAPAA